MVFFAKQFIHFINGTQKNAINKSLHTFNKNKGFYSIQKVQNETFSH